MISRFGMILLCLSGSYCISSTFENLNFEGLKRLWNGETVIKEWNTAMDQNIIKFDANGQKSDVNVREVVQDFVQKADPDAVTEFKSIRNTVVRAYNCTLTKYASLAAFLILQNLCQLKINIYKAINHVAQHSQDFDRRTIFTNDTFQRKVRELNKEKYFLNYDFKFVTGDFQLLDRHEPGNKLSKEIHNVWSGIIDKKLGLKIKSVQIYTDVMRTKFTNEYDQPLVDTINKLICVFNEAVQMFDKFIVDKCGQHDGSFVKNFESLKNGVNGDFVWLLRQFDLIKSNVMKDPSWELYKDFTKTIPGTLPTTGKIRPSGCFVENLEFEISGLKRNMANKYDPTKIYDHNFDERISGINMKLIETNENQLKDGVQVGMILFRDEENLYDDHPHRRLYSRECHLCIVS